MLAEADVWQRGEFSVPHRERFERLIDEAWGPRRNHQLGETHAVLIAQGGKLTYEQYGDGFTGGQTHASWSMAKSITHALTGLLVGDGKIDIDAPADVPEWSEPGDHRGEITLDILLRMSSGLKFIEDYVGGGPPRSDVLEMLYHSGKADMAHYAAMQPLDYPVGSHWHYSSGSTNIVSRCLSRATRLTGEDFHAFMRQRLFEPLGMRSPIPKFDADGTFIGSSYCFCTAEDFLRFGQLYLNGGTWQGRRILPEGWVDYAKTPTRQPADAEMGYGAHWWLGYGGPGSFSANGYEGQITLVVPDCDMVMVRLGKTPFAQQTHSKRWIGELVDCFR
ncbi:MAG TPA: serine hydrolase [Caulobacteraceae bacterium]|nr:serine hydrolase [Caulobacteraceae bacterium]